jgi:hypothetical protein
VGLSAVILIISLPALVFTVFTLDSSTTIK